STGVRGTGLLLPWGRTDVLGIRETFVGTLVRLGPCADAADVGAPPLSAEPGAVSCHEGLSYVWGGRDLRAVAPRSDSANFPGFFSILCSVFRDSVVTIFRVISWNSPDF